MTRPYRAVRPRMVLRNRYLFLLDATLMPTAAALSFIIRFEEWRLWDSPYAQQALLFVVLTILVKPLVYFSAGLYAQMWRYSGRKEAQIILVAVSTCSAVLTVAIQGLSLPEGLGQYLPWPHLVEFPRSVIVIDWLLGFLLVGGPRAAVRLLPVEEESPKAINLHKPNRRRKRVLIVGAGEAGAKVVHEILNNPGLGLVPGAFIDDDPRKLNTYVHGVQVLGNRYDIPRLAQMLEIQEAILALPTAPGRELRSIIQICEQTPVKCRVLPGFFELINGQISLNLLRDPSTEDVLRRTPVDLGIRDGPNYLEGASVLVTGAGGSIGSELCRQVAALGPGRLIVLGHGENSIYEVTLELSRQYPSLNVVPVIADIKAKTRIERLLGEYRPDVVFHAAAHKHVPLMESNVGEVVANNIFGTKKVLEASLNSGVSRFVFVSSDKAVNPVSVMGVSKRVGELLVQLAAEKNGGPYVSVRFGNVLGSRGSVVPLFLAQINSGGPVTVSHPVVTRYFMTSSEAVHLILRAAALGRGGEIFVLDMGEPVRIADLAKDLIRLRGFEVGRDVQIVYTGLRPGEKLCEELFSAHEVRIPCENPSIFVASSDDANAVNLDYELRELAVLVQEGSAAAIKNRLKRLVPEYQSDGNSLSSASTVSRQ